MGKNNFLDCAESIILLALMALVMLSPCPHPELPTVEYNYIHCHEMIAIQYELLNDKTNVTIGGTNFIIYQQRDIWCEGMPYDRLVYARYLVLENR